MYTLSGDEKDLLKSLIGHEYGYTDMFNIPFIVHSPGDQLPSVMDGSGGQVDILPTVANLLGVPVLNPLHFGQDMFNQESNLIPLRHFLPTGSFVNDQSIYVTGHGYADGAALSLLDLSNSYLLQLQIINIAFRISLN